MQTTDLFITSVNNYFESQKPDFAMQCPFFFNWVDLNNTMHDYDTYANVAGMVFYNEVYNKAQHFGVIPQSVANMEGVNDLKNPINTMNEALAFCQPLVPLQGMECGSQHALQSFFQMGL